MFEISYRIPQEVVNDIFTIDFKKFDATFNDIEGQIELNFNGNKYGLCHEEVPFGNELLLFWFGLLNNVIFRLEKSSYVAMNIPETSDWFFQFTKIQENIRVDMAKTAIKNRSGFVIDSILQDIESYQWRNVEILYEEFKAEVSKKTGMLVEEIKSINSELLKSEHIGRFVSCFYKSYNE
jgi:hypothetical protein